MFGEGSSKVARMLVRSPAPHALQPPSASLGDVSCARREMIFAPTAIVRSQASACRCHHLALLTAALSGRPSAAIAAEFAYQPALQGKDYGKSEMSYSDFVKTPSGLLYKDGKVGTGKKPEQGDRVVIDWTGYTIGYFGRPFETKKLREVQGDEKDFLRFYLGDGTMIPALNEGLAGMAEGGVRQLVVQPQIGYPANDPGHDKVGPKPTTFSGERALNFVLENRELIDKTLLFNVKLIRVDSKQK